MIRLRADPARLRRLIRQREIDSVFRYVPRDAFDEALELGAGDGFQSQFLAVYAKRVLSTDLDPDRLRREARARVTYEICDAENLPYESGRFDLIYTSNLLEHLPHPQRALSEMCRVLRDDGIAVHVVPNRIWKVLQFVLFVPSQLLSIAEILVSSERRKTIGEIEGPGNNPQRGHASFFARNVFPEVHGEAPTHVVEFVRMGASYWERLFSEEGFHIVGQVPGLPAHSPYRFGLESPRRLLEKIGLSSCNGYVLSKTGQPYRAAQYFGLGGCR